MVLNQDGSVQMQLGETEIGQGGDTAFSQMAADAIGVKMEDVHIVSTQDTDVTPFGLGAYASRQTFVSSFSITNTARVFKEKILDRASKILEYTPHNLDLVDSMIINKITNKPLLSLGELATEALYDTRDLSLIHI